MANIKIPRKTFEKEIGKLDKTMQNKIALFGTTLENFNDEEIEIEIFPNRPDLLSYHGFKRSFMSFLGKKSGIKEYKINKPEKNYEVFIDSSLKGIRPYTACAIIKGLNLNQEKIKEIIEVQEKLHSTIGRKRKKLAIGIYPLEKIKLPITFKALKPEEIKFTPLESNKEMTGLQILQKHKTGREYSHLLSDKSKFPVFIDKENNILSMPPIINSELTGRIREKTKDVFIECSGFDFETINKCLNILTTILADMGGKIYQIQLKGLKKELTPNLTPEKTKISTKNINKTLGLELNEKEIKNLFKKMGHDYKTGIVETPAWRTDILHEVDLIEEIAIAYGYDNFIPEIPDISTIGQENNKETIKRKIAEILSNIKIIEVSNYHLTKKQDQFTKMEIPKKQEIEIEESKTEYKILRKNLTHYILKNLSENVDSEYPQLIFETGKIFESITKEKENLSIAIIPGNFTEIKQILLYLSKMLGITIKLREPETHPNHFLEGRTAEIFLNQKSLGFLGEIHPKILKNWKIKMPVALLEIGLEEIFNEIN